MPIETKPEFLKQKDEVAGPTRSAPILIRFTIKSSRVTLGRGALIDMPDLSACVSCIYKVACKVSSTKSKAFWRYRNKRVYDEPPTRRRLLIESTLSSQLQRPLRDQDERLVACLSGRNFSTDLVKQASPTVVVK